MKKALLTIGNSLNYMLSAGVGTYITYVGLHLIKWSLSEFKQIFDI